MKRYSLSHLDAHQVRSGLLAFLAAERGNTADVLAHIAEFDDRRLYLPEAYSSMHAYCVDALHLSEDAAFKRIRAARTARRFPAIFDEVASGRLHLAAVVLLSPHLTHDNAAELIAAARQKRRSEIELLLAERFPQPDLATSLRAVQAAAADHVVVAPTTTFPGAQLAPGPVAPSCGAISACEMVPLSALAGATAPAPPAPAAPLAPPARMTPRSPGRFALQVMLEQKTHDKIRSAMDLLGNRIARGDIAEVIDRAMDLLVPQLEREKFAASERPRVDRGNPSTRTRHIPAHVKRAVWKRDRGQCTFVSESGHRCETRAGVEFDHRKEFARGGEATVDGIRLRCRAHNQFTAERTFGAEFMSEKREASRRSQGKASARRSAAARANEACDQTAAMGTRAEHAPVPPHRKSSFRPVTAT